jgi:hypothetical protein
MKKVTFCSDEYTFSLLEAYALRDLAMREDTNPNAWDSRESTLTAKAAEKELTLLIRAAKNAKACSTMGADYKKKTPIEITIGGDGSSWSNFIYADDTGEASCDLGVSISYRLFDFIKTHDPENL